MHAEYRRTKGANRAGAVASQCERRQRHERRERRRREYGRTDLFANTLDDVQGQSGCIDASIHRWSGLGIGETIWSARHWAVGESKIFGNLGNAKRNVLSIMASSSSERASECNKNKVRGGMQLTVDAEDDVDEDKEGGVSPAHRAPLLLHIFAPSTYQPITLGVVTMSRVFLQVPRANRIGVVKPQVK